MEEKKTLKVKVAEGKEKAKEKAKKIWTKVKGPVKILGAAAAAGAVGYGIGKLTSRKTEDPDMEVYDLDDPELEELVRLEELDSVADTDVEVIEETA